MQKYNEGSGLKVEDIAVIIPFYKSQLNELETKSLLQCVQILHRYKLVFIHPEGLDLSMCMSLAPNSICESFRSYYFKSILRYNRLLISPSFYRRFSDYKYILIYQLDAWVFFDAIVEWCDKGYDYIGAPWIEEPEGGWTSSLLPFTRLCVGLVGNGGLSLRKVSSHLKISTCLRLVSSLYFYNEDFFWSFVVPKLFRRFSLPGVDEALRFAVEQNPRETFELNGRQLPFGCHAWHYRDTAFWKDYIPFDPEE